MADSIWRELKELEDYTNSQIGYNSWFGDRDPGADEYPVIRYLTQPGENYSWNDKLSSTRVKVNAEIIVKKENELKAWEVYENWLKKIMQYNEEHGHELIESYDIERDEINLKIVSGLYIKMIALDS